MADEKSSKDIRGSGTGASRGAAAFRFSAASIARIAEEKSAKDIRGSGTGTVAGKAAAGRCTRRGEITGAYNAGEATTRLFARTVPVSSTTP